MEKHTQDKSSTDTKSISGQDPDRYSAGYGSFDKEDYDKKEVSSTAAATSDTEPIAQPDKANIKSGLNEDKSTVSDESAPSGSMADEAPAH